MSKRLAWWQTGGRMGGALRRWWAGRSPWGRRGLKALLAALLLWLGFGPGGTRVHHVGGHDALIAQHAAAAGLDEDLVRSVVTHESSGRAYAESNKAARGLMQITPITERDVLARNRSMEKGDLFDPDYNLEVGTTYLAYLLKRFDGDRVLAVAAYHMGPTAVRRAMNADPELSSREVVAKHAGPKTRAYLAKVLRDAE